MFVDQCVVLKGALRLLGILVLGVAPVWAQAEAVVRGQIVAAADGSALAHARVMLASASGETLQTATDDTGVFVFQRIRPGEYVLSAIADGFGARQIRVLIEPREVRVVTLALDVGGLELSVTVAADIPLTGTHSPSSTVLAADRLEAMPVPHRTTLPDALVTLAPGMIRGHDDFVHIRGHEVALNPLMNGVSFWENPHALFSSSFSPDVIETANVMTGGFPAEYGNRFGGVVDIVTKSGFTLRDKGTVTVNGGQGGRLHASGEVGGYRGRFAYYLFAGAFGSDRFLSPPDRRAIHDRGRGGHAFAQMDGDLASAGAIRVVLTGDGAGFEIPKTPVDLEFRPSANAEQRTRQQTAIVGWTRPWANTFMSASGYQRWSRARLLPADGPLTARADLERKLLTVGAKADLTRTTGRHTFKTGLDLVRLRPAERLVYDYTGYNTFTHLLGLPHIHVAGSSIAFAGRDFGGQVSAYAQDTVAVGPVTADVGVRVDRYDLVVSATHASPRVNAAVQVGGSVLHASYNRFFVPPPIEGVLSSSAGLTSSIREINGSLPPLEPTIEDQFELGITMPVQPLRVAVTGYLRTTDDPVHTTVWPDSRIYSYASFDRARARGLEVKVDAPALARYGVTGYANYALGRVYFHNPVTGGFTTESAHLVEASRFLGPMDQTHTLTGGVTYTHAGTGVWVGTAVEYGSGTPIGHGASDHAHGEGEAGHEHADTARAARVSSHTTVNLSFGATLLRRENRRPRLAVQLDVENIGNRAYVIAQESAFSPTQYSIPRLASLTARLRF